MLIFLTILCVIVAVALVLGGPLLLLLWASARGDEEISVQLLARTPTYRFNDRRFWEAFVSWMRAKPARLVHYKAE